MKTKQTDNYNLAGKVALRLHLLNRFHEQGVPRVFDACKGDGRIWKAVREEFKVASYWGTDLKPKAGTLKVDSRRVIGLLRDADVVDIDTYGDPWEHWFTLLRDSEPKRPMSVFLTHGAATSSGPMSAHHMSKVAVESLGVVFRTMKPPVGLVGRLRPHVVEHCLGMAFRFGYVLTYLCAAEGHNLTNYYGARVEPAK